MKSIALLVVLVLVYIFYPTYNLHLKVDVFSDEYELRETNFLSIGKCRQAAAIAAKGKLYHCNKTSVWKKMFGGYTQYNPEIRETQRELSGE